MKADALKKTLSENGIPVLESEPLKLVLDANTIGYTGEKIAEYLREKKIEIEFSDRELAVFMFTPENDGRDFERLQDALAELPKYGAKNGRPNLTMPRARTACSVREAVFSPKKKVRVTEAEGLVCASPLVSCPPAVPIVMSGEVITEEAVAWFSYYGTEYVEVIAK